MIPNFINFSGRSALGAEALLIFVFIIFAGFPNRFRRSRITFKTESGRSNRLLTASSVSPYRQSCSRFRFSKFVNPHAAVVCSKLLMKSSHTAASPQILGRCCDTAFRAVSCSLIIQPMARSDLSPISLHLELRPGPSPTLLL